MNKRANQILEYLTENKQMEVSSLAELLGVSQVTVRKDLDELSEMGLVRREHGYASIRNRDDIRGRLAYHYEKKQKIAEKAASFVSDGETVMIESGSCCALLAERLAQKKDVTVITNSAFIADRLRGSEISVMLLGGIYQRDAQVTVGPAVRLCAENFYVDKFFIGTDGYSSKTGFTNKDQLRAQAVRDMARQAEQVIILTESEKFGRHGTVPLNITSSDISVITDSQISDETAKELEEQYINLIKV